MTFQVPLKKKLDLCWKKANCVVFIFGHVGTFPLRVEHFEESSCRSVRVFLRVCVCVHVHVCVWVCVRACSSVCVYGCDCFKEDRERVSEIEACVCLKR